MRMEIGKSYLYKGEGNQKQHLRCCYVLCCGFLNALSIYLYIYILQIFGFGKGLQSFELFDVCL